MIPAWNRKELLDLADAAIEGNLTSERLSRLEQWVISDTQAAQLYTEYVVLHASLRISRGLPHQLPLREMQPAKACAQGMSSMWTRVDFYQPKFFFALAVALCLAVGGWLMVSQQPKTIAMLTDAKGCKWDAGTLPTEPGTRLTPGRLRLAEGLARIVFTNGVEVRLESPADFELVSPMRCIMHAGKIIAQVPPNAQGFVVETPFSIITDFGTEFGVSVGNDEAAVVEVFRGRVDTTHRRSGHTEVMYEGAVLFFNDSEYGPHLNAEHSLISDRRLGLGETRADWVHITTAQGRGQDTYIQPPETPDQHRDKSLLLIKRPNRSQLMWERRVYLSFDLTELRSKTVTEASLSLCFAPTGFGFASLVPDATFQVYGLLDGHFDHWRAAELTWENAPGCGEVLKPRAGSQVVLLGSFVVPQGEQSGTFQFSSPLLAEFLNVDTNQLATLIIVRETEGTGPSDLVHGFASRQHPTLPPPTLRLKLSDL